MLLWSTFWFVLFATFALYAFSGAGWTRRLPALRVGLSVVAAIYGIRSLAVAPQLIWLDQSPVSRPRDVAFSLLAGLLALGYATGARATARVDRSMQHGGRAMSG